MFDIHRGQGVPAIAEGVEDIVPGAVQRQAVAGVQQPPQCCGALEVDHLLDVELDLCITTTLRHRDARAKAAVFS